MSRTAFWVGIFFYGMLVAVPGAAAQHRLPVSLELRGGATHPVPCLAMCTDTPDHAFAAGWEAGADVRLLRGLAVYAAYSGYSLADDADYTARGSGAGVGVRLAPAPDRRVSPWLRAGLTRHRRTFRYADDAGEHVEQTSRPGWGREVAAGISIPLGSAFALTPGLRYHGYSVQVYRQQYGFVQRTTHLVAFDLGIRFEP